MGKSYQDFPCPETIKNPANLSDDGALDSHFKIKSGLLARLFVPYTQRPTVQLWPLISPAGRISLKGQQTFGFFRQYVLERPFKALGIFKERVINLADPL